MSETKHTLGKWTYEPSEMMRHGKNNYVHMYRDEDKGTHVVFIGKIHKDYADIIAAAPEMLEAAEEVLERCQSKCVECPICTAYEDEQDCTIKRLKAAVDKAKGGTE